MPHILGAIANLGDFDGRHSGDTGEAWMEGTFTVVVFTPAMKELCDKYRDVKEAFFKVGQPDDILLIFFNFALTGWRRHDRRNQAILCKCQRGATG